MLNIIPIPALKDNYIWTLHNQRHAVIIDPGEAAPVLAYLNDHNLTPIAILCTHHHKDHTGGIYELTQVYNVPVYGPQREIIPRMTQGLIEGDVVEIVELSIKLDVIDIPGHTQGHIAYLMSGNIGGFGGVFCGDTLFGCGCGKLLGGTAVQLLHALQRLAGLPDETKVYCGHEYTAANIRFALACEPGNARLKQRQEEVAALRIAGQPTLPSTIAIEKSTNPFLRCTKPEIIDAVQRMTPATQDDETSIFTALRGWKDRF